MNNNKKIDVLLKKYETFNREWNSISVSIHVCFSAGVIGFIIGLVFMNFIVIITTYAFISLFAVYELKIRGNYIESKQKLENEVFKLAKTKIKIKEIVGRTIFD